jgi:hypothetical protein
MGVVFNFCIAYLARKFFFVTTVASEQSYWLKVEVEDPQSTSSCLILYVNFVDGHVATSALPTQNPCVRLYGIYIWYGRRLLGLIGTCRGSQLHSVDLLFQKSPGKLLWYACSDSCTRVGGHNSMRTTDLSLQKSHAKLPVM